MADFKYKATTKYYFSEEGRKEKTALGVKKNHTILKCFGYK